ncbi:hypothetical protein LY76DRAFT_157636 [Colletotrichum caudatum]|nr:hypothetical protein LY76DRAFT_157636 [Colletotrichum caudatum]
MCARLRALSIFRLFFSSHLFFFFCAACRARLIVSHGGSTHESWIGFIGGRGGTIISPTRMMIFPTRCPPPRPPVSVQSSYVKKPTPPYGSRLASRKKKKRSMTFFFFFLIT